MLLSRSNFLRGLSDTYPFAEVAPLVVQWMVNDWKRNLKTLDRSPLWV